MKRLRLFAVLGLVALTMTSCNWADLARSAQSKGEPVPWWCAPTEEIPVTDGPAAGSVNWYAGTHKSPLSWANCLTLSEQLDQARAYGMQWPTRGVAEAAGWHEFTPYVPGMGTHHVRGQVTPAMLVDPAFNRLDPILDSVGLDGSFDPTKPDVMQYDGSGANAKLVGMDYYVRTTTGLPPEGFPGNNDWWHHHPWICHRLSDAKQIGFNISDASCTAAHGVNVNLSNYYMLHIWVLDDMVFTPDVYAGMMPCIANGTAVHDPMNSCHVSRTGMAMGAMSHDMDMGG